MASQLVDHAHRSIGRGLAVVLAGSLVAAGCGSSAGSEGAQQATAASIQTSVTETTQLDESASTPLETSTTVAPTTVAETTAPAELVVASELACDPITDGRDNVEILTLWEPGVVRNLELTKAKEGTAGSRAEGYSVTPIRVEMLEETDDEERFQWTQGATTVYMNGVQLPPDVLGPLQALAEGLEIHYSIDYWSGVIAVDNIDELRRLMFATLDLIGETDPDVTAVVEQMFGGMDDGQLSLLLTEDMQIYHYFDYGWFSEGEVFEMQEELPNAFGEENFPATTTLTVKSFVDEDGCVLVESVTRPEPVEMRRILEGFLTELAGTDGDSPELDGMQMELENRVVLQFDAMSGIVHSVVATQEMTFDGESRIETTTLVDVTE